MLTGSRLGQIVAVGTMLAGVLVLTVGHPAAADDPYPGGSGSVTCNGDSCTLTARSPASGASGPGVTNPGNQPRGEPNPRTEIAGTSSTTTPLGLLGLVRLYGPQPITIPGQAAATRLVGKGFPSSAPPDGPSAAPAAPPSPAEVARMALSQLHPTSPAITMSPAGDQIVRMPTWLWISPGGWAPVSATAEVPGVSVTATAVPRSVRWSMGDGDSVTCDGPGTPFSSNFAPTASSPDCGHTYVRSSARQPDLKYHVVATITWDVTWAGAGQSGVFAGLQTTAQTSLRVAEVQAVVVGSL